MIRALTQNEQFVFNMFMDAKRQSHKFNVPYIYTVEAENVKIISNILVAMNVGVHIESINETSAKIQIFHMRTKDCAMLTYCKKLRFDNDFNCIITEEEKQIVKESSEMILNALRFNDSLDPDI